MTSAEKVLEFFGESVESLCLACKVEELEVEVRTQRYSNIPESVIHFLREDEVIMRVAIDRNLVFLQTTEERFLSSTSKIPNLIGKMLTSLGTETYPPPCLTLPPALPTN